MIVERGRRGRELVRYKSPGWESKAKRTYLHQSFLKLVCLRVMRGIWVERGGGGGSRRDVCGCVCVRVLQIPQQVWTALGRSAKERNGNAKVSKCRIVQR